MALSIYNTVTLTRTAGTGPEAGDHPSGRAQELVEATAAAFARATGSGACGGFHYVIAGDVPPARGLGSSATIIVGVLVGLDALAGTGWPRGELAALATAIEGNPDNVTPSLLGGFTVTRCDPASGAYVDTVRVPVPAELVFVVTSPSVELVTKESRGRLPATVTHRAAAKSVNSAAYLTAVFATGDFEKLRGAAGDFLHEPYRLPGIAGAEAAITAGVRAGALTGWLSGSGSSVLCVVRAPDAVVVGHAMQQAFAAAGAASTVRRLVADNRGAVVG